MANIHQDNRGCKTIQQQDDTKEINAICNLKTCIHLSLKTECSFLFNRNTDRKVSETDPQGKVVKCVEIKFLVNCVQHIELLTIMCTSVKHDQITLSYRVFFLTGTPPKSSKYKKVNLG